MKKYIFLLFLAFSPFIFAQNQTDKKADETLKSLSKKYNAYTTVHADFSFKIDHPEQKTSEIHNGSLLSKGSKYKLLMNEQEIVCDGKTMWTYSKETNEVNLNEVNLKANAMNPGTIFTMYESGFLFKLLEEKNEGGKIIQTIELIPTDKSKKFFKVQLTVNKTESLLIKSKIFNKDGSHLTVHVLKLSPNLPIPEEQFTFNVAAHPKVEIIDLR